MMNSLIRFVKVVKWYWIWWSKRDCRRWERRV